MNTIPIIMKFKHTPFTIVSHCSPLVLMKKKFLIVFAFMCCLSNIVSAQLKLNFDFAAPTTYNATLKGYERTGVGVYFRTTSGGTITFGTQSCYGYTISAPTGSSQFFYRTDRDLNFAVIKAYSGSNRTYANLATSATLNGTYTAVPYTAGGSISSNTCGMFTVTPATVIPAGTFIRFTFSGNIEVVALELDVVPTGTPPSITTNSVTPGKNNAVINGTVTPGTMPLMASGVIWSTSNTPLDTTLATRTRNTPAATAAFGNTATGLTPGQTYYTKAYVIDLTKKVYYGQTLQFTTLPATAPTVNTITPFNILPLKATSGGNNIDSGGLAITDKGLCWSTTPNPTIGNAGTVKLSAGPNGNDFTAVMRILQPSTKYYVRAYAINGIGTGYGNEQEFTTAAPAPVLTASPLSLNFGTVPYGSYASVLNYKLTGSNLTPSSGTITISAPAGFTLGTAINGTFANTLTLNYNGGVINNVPVYVKMNTSTYGSLSGYVVHAGGGLIAANADSVLLNGKVIPDPNVTTNAGTDFWTGFGYQERMDRISGDANETKLSLYISVPAGSPSALVNVDLPGIAGASGFPKQNLTVAPGSVLEVSGFPTGDPGDELNPNGLPDARLYYTGISRRGIHIYSTNGVPISVWMHTYAQNNSAAGTMLFPTNTWNNEYTVQAYGGQLTSIAPVGGFTNNSNPNSFFFVIANEDNTPIWITPSQDIIDSSTATLFTEGHTASMVKYAKGVTYGPIILNKGEIFNAMGFINGTGSGANGLDLSGTKVRTNCDKKIAVFGGNGRCLVNASNCNATAGSDHMIQQMFPSVAWGNKYLTIPTKTMEYNLFRVNVGDPLTKVWVNKVLLTGLINNQYYQFNSALPNLIESDKPINVTQFIVAGQCNTSKGFAGDGDPEMIILSPVQQAINNVTVYSATIKKTNPGVNGHYINVIIPKKGIQSFKLDGLTTCDTGRSQVGASATNCYDPGGTIAIQNAFQKHPNDTNYYYAKFKVAPGAAHTLYSDSTFVAIAYGMGSGESYGYNAGTNIKDLTRPLFIDNPYQSNNNTNSSCTNTPVYLKAVLPYPPSQVTGITWNMSMVPGISPQTDITIPNPTPESTYLLDGVTYYVYKNPTPYTFSTVGSYYLTGSVNGTFVTQCGSSSPFNFYVNITEPGYADFNIQYDPCVSDTVRFTDMSSGNGYAVSKWEWNFGDATTDTVQNPKKVYATSSVYSIKLRAINSIGCFADTTKVFDMTANLKAKFGVADTICINTPVVFTDSSSNAGLGGGISKWTWQFGKNATPLTVTADTAQTYTFTTAGVDTVTLTVQTTGGCTAVYKKEINVRPAPAPDFDMPSGVCLPASGTFNNLTTIADTTINTVKYVWNFGDGNPGSTDKNPAHVFPNVAPPVSGYAVQLTATSKYGCSASKIKNFTALYTKPKAGFTAPAKICLKDTAQFNDTTSAAQGQAVTKWMWMFGDSKTDTVKNPLHAYAAAGTYPIKLVITTDKGCVSDTSAPFQIKVNPMPVAGFALPPACLSSGSVTFVDTSKITPNDGTQLPFTYLWNFGDPASGSSNTATTKDGQHQFTAPGTYQVNLTVTSAQGCTSDKELAFTITGSRPVSDFALATAVACANDTVRIKNTSTIAIGTITKVEIIWDNVGSPAVVETDNSPAIGKIYSHKYPNFQSPATRTFFVRIRNYSGTTCMHDTIKPVVVNAAPLTALANQPGICLNAAPKTLTGGTESSGLPGTWYYSGNGVTPPATFDPAAVGAGTHAITYTFVTAAGCRDSSAKNVVVWPLPLVKFGNSTPACETNTVTFTDSSVAGAGSITQWTWLMGNSATPIIKTNNTPFTHVYADTGTYNVSLQVLTSNGCSSTALVKPVKINAKPVVDFTLPAAICLPDGRGRFKDASTIKDGTQSGFTYFWRFGDGGTSTGKEPIHQYTAASNYTVRLIVTSNAGCKDSAFKVFNAIYAQPKAAVSTIPADPKVCAGTDISFTDNSNGMGWPVVRWRWDYGDGTADTTASAVKSYMNGGKYTVRHFVFNSKGCVSDTVYKEVEIYDYPVIKDPGEIYVVSGSSVILNLQISYIDNFTKYKWTPASFLSEDSVRNPVCTPLDDFNYKFKVTNGVGCSAERTVQVRLYRPPIIPNAFSPNGDGINDKWQITHLNTYRQAKVEIFNRYGQMVYRASAGYINPWDGTSDGKPLPVGTYYYIISLGVIEKPITGHVTILR